MSACFTRAVICGAIGSSVWMRAGCGRAAVADAAEGATDTELGGGDGGGALDATG